MILRGAVRAVENFHGKGAATGFELSHRSHVIGEGAGLQGGGHDDYSEIGAAVFLQIKAATKSDIDGEATLVELIEDDSGDSFEAWVLMEDSLEDAVGKVEDFCFSRIFCIEADGVSDLLAKSGVSVLCDEAGEESCGHPARLDYDDAPFDFREIRQHTGDLGGFPRAGRSGEENAGFVWNGGGLF